MKGIDKIDTFIKHLIDIFGVLVNVLLTLRGLENTYGYFKNFMPLI